MFNMKIEKMADFGRFNLRCKKAHHAAISDALGFPLPTHISALTQQEDHTALKLGPDEWFVTCPMEARTLIAKALGDKYHAHPHSLTDISSREISILVEGSAAEELLSTACPRDLSKLAPNHGIRTIFSDTQIVLTRIAQTRFRLDVWRSFAPHILGLLNAASTEFKSG